MNSPISEQEFDQLLSKHGGQSTISNKSSGPISLDEFDKMISGAEQKPQSTSESIFSYLRNIPNAARQEIQGVPQFVSHGELNNPAINEFVEKSLGGLGFEGPALAGIAKRGATALGEKLSPVLGKFTGKEAAERSGNIINDLLGKHNLSEYHEPILGKVRQNYASNVEAGSKEYNAIKELANREGYKGQSQLSRALGEKNAKSINDSVLHKLEKLDIDKGSSLSEAVENFKRNPSFKAAHELQSELGKEGASKIKSLDSGDASLGDH
jgi:hypothetical protein